MFVCLRRFSMGQVQKKRKVFFVFVGSFSMVFSNVVPSIGIQ